MRDMPTQKYMFLVDSEPVVQPVVQPDGRPRGKRDPDHEARKLLAGEIEAAIMFNNKHICNPGKLTPEQRGAVAQAIRAQATRKRPRSERNLSLARKVLATQIEYLLIVYELTKSNDTHAGFGKPADVAVEVGRLVKRIGVTLNTIKVTENVTK
jgi:hypothetical protein